MSHHILHGISTRRCLDPACLLRDGTCHVGLQVQWWFILPLGGLTIARRLSGRFLSYRLLIVLQVRLLASVRGTALLTNLFILLVWGTTLPRRRRSLTLRFMGEHVLWVMRVLFFTGE